MYRAIPYHSVITRSVTLHPCIISDACLFSVMLLQVALSALPQSAYPALCGLIAGILYRSVPLFARIRYVPLSPSQICDV